MLCVFFVGRPFQMGTWAFNKTFQTFFSNFEIFESSLVFWKDGIRFFGG